VAASGRSCDEPVPAPAGLRLWGRVHAAFRAHVLDFHIQGLDRIPRRGPGSWLQHISFWDPPWWAPICLVRCTLSRRPNCSIIACSGLSSGLYPSRFNGVLRPRRSPRGRICVSAVPF